jgi:hypothetical protein
MIAIHNYYYYYSYFYYYYLSFRAFTADDPFLPISPSDKAKVDEQIKTGVSLVLTNKFLENSKDFIMGLMFRENSGRKDPSTTPTTVVPATTGTVTDTATIDGTTSASVQRENAPPSLQRTPSMSSIDSIAEEEEEEESLSGGDREQESEATRGQWPVILNLVVPTELNEFEIINTDKIRLAARAENMRISDLVEPTTGRLILIGGSNLMLMVDG